MRLDRVLALVLTGLLMHAAPVMADTSSPHTLTVSATVPVIDVAAREAPSRSYVLPALDYTISLSADCARPFDPVSILVTVADSQQRINAQQLAQDAGESSVALVVPADQLAPVSVPEFCRTNAAGSDSLGLSSNATDPAASTDTLTIAGVLSASLSLRCSDGERQEIVYSSQPLDLTLRCEAGEPPTVSSPAGDSE